MYGKPKLAIFLLRISMGWFFFYSGITKILDSEWTSRGFLEHANTFSGFFGWLASSQNIAWVDFVNQWGQLLIGAGLILGVFTGIASAAGILMMLLYYFPGLDFPFVEHGFLVDDHIIYALAFFLLIRLRAGKIYSLTSLFSRSPY